MQKKIKDDAISRQAAIDELDKFIQLCDKALRSHLITPVDAYATKVERASLKHYREVLESLPSAQPDYQEVLGWLLAYHTMSFDLHGRYLPHEVISWLINDFTKEFIAERGQNG